MQAQPSLKPGTANPGNAGIASHSLQRGVPGQVPRFPVHLLVYSAVTICVLIFGAIVLHATRHLSLSASSADSIYEDNLDQSLQRAATRALGDRRGAIIIMDPQTGRVRAVVNPTVAFGENLPPGSTIKPFTALAALRSGVIDEESRNVCREKYAHDDFHTTCSHPRDLPPLN